MFVTTKNIGKRYVIPDIHGCLQTFKELLNKINFSKNDLLFLLGDYIDRGKNSSGVIDLILELQSTGYNIHALRGNHENDILSLQHDYDKIMFRSYLKRITKSEDLIDENTEIIEKYRIFFENLPFYFEFDNFILVHAGLNFKNDNPFSDLRTMLEIRWFEKYVPTNFSKIIIHGHNPTYLSDIELAIKNKKKVIPLDNGCIYSKPHKFYDYKQLGKLCCFNIDTYELILQDNIE